MSILQLPAMAHGGQQTRVDRVVIHATVSPCKPGGARANAYWFQRAAAGVSAHYCVDPTEVVQCLPDDVIGYHAPPNTGSIGVELCDPQYGPDTRWDDEPHRQMLLRAAALVADLCARHDLPVAYVDAAGLLLGRRGITTHAQVSRAWRKSTHTDPGAGWPRDQFLELVQQAGAPARPTPPVQEDDMPLTDDDVEKVAQRAAALVRADLRTILGTDPSAADVDPTHYSLGDIGRQLARLTQTVNGRGAL